MGPEPTIEEQLKFKTLSSFDLPKGMYKIPGFRDIPIVFNVSLLRNSPNDRAIHSSKGVGEVYVPGVRFFRFYMLQMFTFCSFFVFPL